MEFVFPFLADLTKDQQKDPRLMRKRISSWNAVVNVHLKEIAKKINKKLEEEKSEIPRIDEELSFHCARHSFAQYCVNEKEIPAYKIMMLLGHKSIKTTMQYLKALDLKTVDTVMDEIF